LQSARSGRELELNEDDDKGTRGSHDEEGEAASNRYSINNWLRGVVFLFMLFLCCLFG
jgi:hypothetical protein